MADSFQFKACHGLEWKTELPYIKMDRKSPVFRVRGIQHRFRFYRDEYFFYVVLELIDQASQSSFRSFGVTVHIELKSGSSTHSVYGPSTVTCTLTDYLFFLKQSTISSKTGNDLSRCNMMRFLFTFDSADQLELPGSEDKRENKSTQTPEHLDAHFGIRSLSEDLSKLLDEDSSSDVELKCGNVTFKAHKNVLSTRSKIFRAMLENDMKEGKTGQVDIADSEADVIRQLLKYLYSGKFEDLTVDGATQLYAVGDKYDVEALKKECATFLANNLCPDNACGILILADRHTDSDLKEIATAYILDQKIFLQDDIWDDFCDEHPALASKVLKRFCKSLASCK